MNNEKGEITIDAGWQAETPFEIFVCRKFDLVAEQRDQKTDRQKGAEWNQ